ncbi:zinc-binding dehydrogenase [Streptomyces roseus]|uniref:zinc-binding dehydrogenase n=1 Tax=Streptomyces roseus TaxID=66430 RepID=UPI0033E70BD0
MGVDLVEVVLGPLLHGGEEAGEAGAEEVAADGALLAELVGLVDAGALTLRVSRTIPLADAVKAHVRLAEPGTRGRLVLTTA